MGLAVYKARKSGGSVVINMPKETLGTTYKRSVWKDGKIVFERVDEL